MIVPLVLGMVTGLSLTLAAKRAWTKGLRGGPRHAMPQRGFERGVEDVPMAVFQSTGVSFLDGNCLDWKNDIQIFEALEDAFLQAKHSIHVDLYIWKPTGPGPQLAQLAAKRAREGIAVRILVDPMGSPGFEEELAPLLLEAGCEVHFFRRPDRMPFKILGRNHRKLVVVDGRVGFTGGFGIGGEWSGDNPDMPAWRDSNIRVEGPVVRQMQQAFATHWLETGGNFLPEEEFNRTRHCGEAKACFVTSMDVKGLSNARWVTHVAIAAAKKQLWIENAYFVPPPDLLGALCERRPLGTDVRVLVPGPYSDHVWVKWLQRSSYPMLRRYGVRVFEYQPSMIHAKTILVDRRLVVVGSTNMDPLSQDVLEEGSLLALDDRFAQQLEAHWEEDARKSVEILEAPVEPHLASMLGGSGPVPELGAGL